MGTHLRNIFKIHRFLGLFPFDNKFQWSKILMAYCLFIQLLTLHSIIGGFIEYYENYGFVDNKSLSALLALNYLVNLVGFLSNILTVIHLTRKRDVVLYLLDRISKEIDECRDFPKITFYGSLPYCICILAILTWISFTDDGYSLKTLYNVVIALLFSNSTISITSQLWGLMHVIAILIQETTKRYDDSSILAIERMSIYVEHISDIYGPFSFIMVMKPFVELVFHSYLLLLPSFPGNLKVNALLLFFIILCFVRLGTLVYSCNRFLNQVISNYFYIHIYYLRSSRYYINCILYANY